MLNNIGYLSYVATMAISLLIFPSAFIKQYETGQTESFLNVQIHNLLQSETGLRICGLFHALLLVAYILKQNQVKVLCSIAYAIFVGSLVFGILIEGVGQQQSEKLERLGFQVGILSFILYNNWHEKPQQPAQNKVAQPQEEVQAEVPEQKKKVEEKSQNKQKKQKSKNE